MSLRLPTVHSLLAAARGQPVLLLAKVQAHPAGTVLGLGSALLGFWLSRQSAFSQQTPLLWATLVGVFLGMLLHWRWKRSNQGWQVDFAARRVQPQGLLGEPVVLQGEDWQVQVAPGDSRRVIAIDLRHPDLGRVARLYEAAARKHADQKALSELADVLAQRLGAQRTGPRID